MSNNWCNFLSTHHGATFNTDQSITFSSATSLKNDFLDSDCLLTDLSWIGTIKASGADKETFLQGQLTNDINSLNESSSQLSGLCSPKGRLRALFHIYNNKDTFYLQLPSGLLEDTLKRLSMFVMMSKVELTNVSDQRINIGLYGKKSEQLLSQYGFDIPSEIDACSHYNNMTLIRISDKNPQFICAGDFEEIQELWTEFSAKSQLINSPQWKLLTIHTGRPTVYIENKEAFIPQMLNLHKLNGINFKKGCYTGQEIVARMQYLGKLKRQMYLAHIDSESSIPIGAPLFAKTTKSGQGIGQIVDAQVCPSGGFDILAVISNEAVDKQDVYLDDTYATALKILTLPYSMETE